MSAGIPLPLHLAVHIVGLAAVAGLLAWAISRRRLLGPAWLAFLVGGLLLTAQHIGLGLVVAQGTAWPVYARAMAYASLAVGIAGTSGRISTGGLPVVVAIAPIAVHVTAGLAGLLAAASAVRGGVRRGGLLASGIALWAAGDMLVRSRPALAAWVALVGSLAVFGWSATVGQTSVRARLMAVTTLLVSLVIVLISAATGTLFADQLRQESIERLRQPAAVLVGDLQATWPSELQGQLRTTSRLPTVREVFSRLGGGAMDKALAELVRQTGNMDLVVLLDRNGIAQSASWRGDPAPVTWLPILQGHPAVVAAATAVDAQVGTALLRADGATRTTVGAFAAAVVLPRTDAGLDERLGTLVAARLVDETDMQRRSRAAAADVVVLAAGDVIQSTRGTGDDAAIEAAVAAGLSRVELSDGELLLASLDGGVIGVPITVGVLDGIGSLGDPEGETARDLFLRALFVMALALLGGVAASRWLARPVTQLTSAVDRVSKGDFDTSFGMEERGDEFGRLAEAFEGMTVSLAARQAALQRAASTEAELRGRLQAITDSMSDGLLATDRHGTVTAANPAVARLLGLDARDVLGRSLSEVLLGTLEDSDKNLADAVAAATGKQRSFSGRGRVSTTDLDVDVTSSPLRGTDGEAPVVGTVVVLRDVSAEAELARARRDFVTNISHELRTPLTLIMAPVKQLPRWRTNEAIAPLQTEILNRGTARMARLERELTEWAQVELGRYANVQGTADLNEVRKRSIDMVAWQFPDREIRVKVPARLKTIAVSNDAVQTILRELTHNAVLFSKHDAKPVDVAFKNVAEGVELTVTDRGVGMDEATLARAFEPYWQRDASERRDFDGLGIGLPLARKVAQAAGTDVTLTSRPGRGTTARVVFPVH